MCGCGRIATSSSGPWTSSVSTSPAGTSARRCACALKSNPVLYEWLVSPIVYVDGPLRAELRGPVRSACFAAGAGAPLLEHRARAVEIGDRRQGRGPAQEILLCRPAAALAGLGRANGKARRPWRSTICCASQDAGGAAPGGRGAARREARDARAWNAAAHRRDRRLGGRRAGAAATRAWSPYPVSRAGTCGRRPTGSIAGSSASRRDLVGGGPLFFVLAKVLVVPAAALLADGRRCACGRGPGRHVPAAAWRSACCGALRRALIVCGLSPLGDILIKPLEDRFPRADSGGMAQRSPASSFSAAAGTAGSPAGQSSPPLNEAAERYTEARGAGAAPAARPG